MNNSSSDEQELRRLIQRYCGGAEDSEAVFHAFYNACKQAVLRIAVHFTGSHEQAKDLSQEIWVKLWKYVCGFRGESKIMSWVYRIALTTYLDKKHILIDVSHRELLRKELNEEHILSGDHLWANDDSLNTFEQFERGAEAISDAVLLEHALQRLTPAERTVFVAKHTQELTFKELAAELGVSEGTLKTLHFRAIKKLQHILAAHYPELALFAVRNERENKAKNIEVKP